MQRHNVNVQSFEIAESLVDAKEITKKISKNITFTVYHFKEIYTVVLIVLYLSFILNRSD